jgi:uncharacterized cupredoxin-like copper-binding protein
MEPIHESWMVITLRRVQLVVCGLVLVGALTLAACSQEPASVPKAQDDSAFISITLTDFGVLMEDEFVPPGPVRFVITNNGAIEHNLYLESVDAIEDPLHDLEGNPSFVENIQSGDTVFLDYHFDAERLEYQLGCHLPGHYEAGMVQVFSVSE